jgi:hypothetical protein
MKTLGEAKCDGFSQDQLKVEWPLGACPVRYLTRATMDNSISRTISRTSIATWSRAETWIPR